MKFLICAIVVLFMSSCDLFKAGSYANAEYYIFEMSNQELIDKAYGFQDMNTQYKQRYMLEKDSNRLGGFDELQRFYTIYFFLPSENATVHCVIKISIEPNQSPTMFGLTGITYSPNFGGWKSINSKDLPKEENKKIKKIFETQILDKLGKWERE